MSNAPITPFLSWSGHTDRGRVRKNNEDSFLGLSLDAQEARYLGKIGEAASPGDYIFAVSDGMGGAMAGEFASRVAVEKITKMLPSYLARLAKSLQPVEEEAPFFALLVELFLEIHRALLFLGSSYEECHGMGTTLSLCWVRSNRVYFSHIGDSRIYHLPKTGSLRQLSEDDTHVGWLFRQGKINEREEKTHPRRHLLQKALGANHQFVTPQVGSLILTPGDRLLLCTDGITDAFFNQQLADILAMPIQVTPSHDLVREAVVQSGKDNATAIIIHIGGEVAGKG